LRGEPYEGYYCYESNGNYLSPPPPAAAAILLMTGSLSSSPSSP